jgi:hypothetical protein
VRKILNAEAIEKAIALCEKGTTESSVAQRPGISPEGAKAAEALYLGKTERLLRDSRVGERDRK